MYSGPIALRTRHPECHCWVGLDLGRRAKRVRTTRLATVRFSQNTRGRTLQNGQTGLELAEARYLC